MARLFESDKAVDTMVPHPDREEDFSALRTQIETALCGVFDPEHPISIFDLGLIYDIRLEEDVVVVDMTLTTPSCPEGEKLPLRVEEAVREVAQGYAVEVRLIWDPPWLPSRMTEVGRLLLGWMPPEET